MTIGHERFWVDFDELCKGTGEHSFPGFELSKKIRSVIARCGVIETSLATIPSLGVYEAVVKYMGFSPSFSDFRPDSTCQEIIDRGVIVNAVARDATFRTVFPYRDSRFPHKLYTVESPGPREGIVTVKFWSQP